LKVLIFFRNLWLIDRSIRRCKQPILILLSCNFRIRYYLMRVVIWISNQIIFLKRNKIREEIVPRWKISVASNMDLKATWRGPEFLIKQIGKSHLVKGFRWRSRERNLTKAFKRDSVKGFRQRLSVKVF